jgi:hypothetical protein
MSAGAQQGKSHSWFRRRWVKGLLLLGCLPVVLFFLSNLWLALPPGRHWVAAKISKRTGFDAGVERASWSPWDGIRISGLVIQQPPALRSSVHEPLFTATSVQIWPKWMAWLQKRIEMHSIQLDSPRAVIPIELIAHLSGPPPVLQTPPVVAAANPAPAPPADGPPPVVAAAAPGAVELPPPQPSIQNTPTPPSAAPSISVPTAWIHVKHGSLAIVAGNQARPLLEADHFNADLPAAGGPASSLATLESIKGLGNEVIRDLKFPLNWQPPVLEIGPISAEASGIPSQLVARIAIAGNLPIAIDFNLPPKESARVTLPNQRLVAADAFRAVGRFRGFLAFPASWQGDFLIEGRGLSTSQPPQADLRFDRGIAVFLLRGGLLACTDARLISDELSLLGNGTVLSDSRGAAVLRIVAPPAYAHGLAERLGQMTGKRITFGLMGTPDRMGSDLYALGNLDGINIQLGQGGDVIDGPTLLALLKAKAAASP